jgi:hypothetical protein
MWVRISCEERERVYKAGHLVPGVVKTDITGEYGPPQMYMEWWSNGVDKPVLKDIRHPAYFPGDPDRLPCEHYHWVGASITIDEP